MKKGTIRYPHTLKHTLLNPYQQKHWYFGECLIEYQPILLITVSIPILIHTIVPIRVQIHKLILVLVPILSEWRNHESDNWLHFLVDTEYEVSITPIFIFYYLALRKK